MREGGRKGVYTRVCLDMYIIETEDVLGAVKFSSNREKNILP